MQSHRGTPPNPRSSAGSAVVGLIGLGNIGGGVCHRLLDRAALKRWLAARHKSYAVWERQHPAAAATSAPTSRDT